MSAERAKARAVTKAARGHNRYCGPAALSALTGIDTEQAARLLRSVSGRSRIRGVHTSELVAALGRLGYECHTAPVCYGLAKRPTLARWLKFKREAVPYLVSLSTHFCVVEGRRYIDNETGAFVALRDAPNRRARVRSALRVVLARKVEPATVIPEPAKRPASASAMAAKARRLAKAHGIRVEVERSFDSPKIWVCTEEDDPAGDPYEGDHYAYDWTEALARVEGYIKWRLS